MTTTTTAEALRGYGIDINHVYPWRAYPGANQHGLRAWRGISLIGLLPDNLDEDDADPGTPCAQLLAVGHDLPLDRLLPAITAHNDWEHPAPRPTNPTLGPADLNQEWALFLRHREYGCPYGACCEERDDGLRIIPAQADWTGAIPVTRIRQPEADQP